MNKAIETSIFPLQNLTCTDCAGKLEKAVSGLPGVHSAQVNIISAKITVRHQGNQGPIRTLLLRQGYLAASEETGFWLQPKTIATILACVFLISALILPAPWKAWFLIAAVLAGGFFPAKAGLINLIYNRTFDIDFLMLIAVIGAVIIGELGEAATVVVLFSASHALEAYTVGRTRSSVHNLLKLAPDTAWIDEEGELVSVPASSLVPGQDVIIMPGERVPVDGDIIAGVSELNQAQVTGEAMPVLREPGQEVYAGSINGSGRLVIRTAKTADQSTLARIVALVEEAATSRPPVQQFIDRFASWYTPLVITLAFGLAIFPPLIFGGAWGEWIYRGLALLVVACPCALVISTPVSIVSALGNAARRGVLIKNGTALEQAAGISIAAMDKTGTLTGGSPRLVTIKPAKGYTEADILTLAASVEQGSSHPLATAVIAAAREQNVQIAAGQEHRTLPGQGAMAIVNGANVYAVSPAYARALGVASVPHSDKTLVVLAREQAELGQLEFQDTLRPGAARTVAELKQLGIEPVMLTGDSHGSAANVAAATGIDRFHAHLLPEDKLTFINQLRNQGKIMMVGDGINDAPALAAADLGVAMGAAGSDTALETADIALMADDLEQLPFVLRLSRRALSVIRFNIWFAIAIKIAAVLLVFPGWLTLWLAILADTGAAIIVTLNSMRLLRAK